MRRPPIWTILITLRLVASIASSPNIDDAIARGAAAAAGGAWTGQRRSPSSSSSSRLGLRLRQVLVIHRHGDRTPITPMRDAAYWQDALPEARVLEGISEGTSVLRHDGGVRHGASGSGPFGQLTMMGLLQMVKLGERLRCELTSTDRGGDAEDGDDDGVEDVARTTMGRLRLFTPNAPLHPDRVRVMSTDFPRTIQSAQALLVGLFPDRDDDDRASSSSTIEIDVRHTNGYFIPDPQPRQHDAQLGLERHLSSRTHLVEREGELREFAMRITHALGEHLGEGAEDVSFGIGEEKEGGDEEEGGGGENDDVDVGGYRLIRRPLAWAQMCEVLVCLNSRGLLPDALSREDVAIVSDHVAWRWFENLGEPILAKSAMFKFARRLVEDMKRKANEGSVDIGVDDRPRGGEDDVAERRKGREEEEEEEKAVEEEPMLRIYSAHDSTLIGLLCVLGLEKPIEWPEYGSALKVELILEEEELANDAISPRRHWVRFSLNGQLLRCTWHRNERDEPASMVPLHELEEMIHMEHELFDDECDDSRLKYSWKGGMLCEH